MFKLLTGEPYRKSKPDSFRKVHRALALAVREDVAIKLSIIENCEPHQLNERERAAIAAFASGGLDG